jgi:hypothetical protein
LTYSSCTQATADRSIWLWPCRDCMYTALRVDQSSLYSRLVLAAGCVQCMVHGAVNVMSLARARNYSIFPTMITRVGLLTHTPRKFPCVNVCELWDVMYARERVPENRNNNY